jgi:hypothetical protein
MNLLLSFLVPLVGTSVIGLVGRVMLGLFAPLKPAGFGGFCCALGYAVAQHSGKVPADWRALEAFVNGAGAIVALALLWRLQAREVIQ